MTDVLDEREFEFNEFVPMERRDDVTAITKCVMKHTSGTINKIACLAHKLLRKIDVV